MERVKRMLAMLLCAVMLFGMLPSPGLVLAARAEEVTEGSSESSTPAENPSVPAENPSEPAENPSEPAGEPSPQADAPPSNRHRQF